MDTLRLRPEEALLTGVSVAPGGYLTMRASLGRRLYAAAMGIASVVFGVGFIIQNGFRLWSIVLGCVAVTLVWLDAWTDLRFRLDVDRDRLRVRLRWSTDEWSLDSVSAVSVSSDRLRQGVLFYIWNYRLFLPFLPRPQIDTPTLTLADGNTYPLRSISSEVGSVASEAMIRAGLIQRALDVARSDCEGGDGA